jgi:hypothetical protein
LTVKGSGFVGFRFAQPDLLGLATWLKDRKGRQLSFDDLFYYQKIVVTLKETMHALNEDD